MSIQHICEQLSLAFAQGDNTKGNDLLHQLMALQDLDSSGEDGKRGNFRWYEDDSEPTDLNALSFCGSHLAYVALEHRPRITPALRDQLWARTLPECLLGYDNHYRVKSGVQPIGPSPRWWQANIWLMNIGGRLMVARALNDKTHIERAREQLLTFERYVNGYGIPEYNSPSYMAHQLKGLHWTWYYASDEAFRACAERLLDLWYLDLAEHYHAASGSLAGTWSRHYERNVTDHASYHAIIASAFLRESHSMLEAHGLRDYQCPAHIRQIALARCAYHVWRRSPAADAKRMLYQTPEFSLATQSGAFIWPQQDTPVLATYLAKEGTRRTALIRTPFWGADPAEAGEYARHFRRWAHQHENQAILSYAHQKGGDDLLFNLATLEQLQPELTDGQGAPLTAPNCPMPPASTAVQDKPSTSPHHRVRSSDLRYDDPAQCEPPGLPIEGPILLGLPSCYLAVVPGPRLTLRVAVIRGDLQVVIPVRSQALLAVLMVGRSTCASMSQFVERISNVTLETVGLPNVSGVRLQGLGHTLTAGRDETGRLFDRRVDELPLPTHTYWCHSPFFTWRPNDGPPVASTASFADNVQAESVS